MTETEEQVYERTHYEATLETRYDVAYNGLHARLYGHLKTALTFLTIIAGSSAFAAFIIADNGRLAAWVALGLAIIAAIDVTVSPAERAARFDAHARRYGELNAAAPPLDLVELDRRLRLLQSESLPGEVDALKAIAYNNCVRENGRPTAAIETTRWQRLMACFA